MGPRMDLQGKAAVVTGGSRGVGAATALMLAKAGCALAINYASDIKAAEATAARCRNAGARAILVQGDVAQDVACRAMIAQATAEFGRLDVLVNNAGTTRFVPFGDLDAVTEADWERIFAVNVRGAFQCARAARAALAADGGGVIINTASVAAYVGAGSSIPYCASKAALINLTLTLARTLAPDIRVNAVAPGFIEGDWLVRGLGADYESIKAKKSSEALLNAVCQPEDIAQVIMGLIAADKVTGQTLVVDAGHSHGPRLAHGIK